MMSIFFTFVVGSLFLSTGWSLYRIRKFDIYKKPLFEGTIINVSIHIIGMIWWILTNREMLYLIVPGILYYVISVIIINTINWLILSLLKPKKLKVF